MHGVQLSLRGGMILREMLGFSPRPASSSQTNRFSRQRRLSLGPGAYHPREVGNRKDFNRAPVSRCVCYCMKYDYMYMYVP